MFIFALTLSFLTLLCALIALSIVPASMDRTQRISTRLDELLPQTQCRQCGFDGCKPYADAIARRAAPINSCPPGGVRTANAIAELIGADRVAEIKPVKPIGNDLGLVLIDEDRCIGCTKCLPVCPVDAIIGAQKQLHIVISNVCTGCGLCIPPCPVDCISFVPSNRSVELIDNV